ncbi:hypothetical protein BRD19_03605, partial [Halobacteriales archaeon SW_7_65_23]
MTDDPTTTADGTETGRTDSDSGNRSDADDRNQWTARKEFDDPDRMEELEEANAELRERVAELESIVADIAPGTGTTDRPRAEQVDDEGGTDSEAKPVLPSGGQPQKVVGKFENPNGGVGVYGHNTATSGTTYGVWGEVNSPDGYGIATPDAARIEGVIDTNETDFVVEAGTQSTEDAQNVVLGHASNVVTGGAVGATISGGGYDSGSIDRSHEVTANYGTVAGGYKNTVSGSSGTVGGGFNSTASGDYSFAAGRFAEAGHEGTFVWADSDISIFSSTGADQFLVEADGGMGVGTDAPGSQLHVTDTLAEDNTDPSGHVATIENESGSSSADVLLLQTGETDPGGTNKYVTFADANGAIG